MHACAFATRGFQTLFLLKLCRRHLSAQNWRKQRNQVSPDFNSSMTTSSFSDDDNDFLASSMVSQKTVCSDAFDFLFDENNLNPEQALHKEFNRQHSTITEVSHAPLVKKGEGSVCCVISWVSWVSWVTQTLTQLDVYNWDCDTLIRNLLNNKSIYLIFKTFFVKTLSDVSSCIVWLTTMLTNNQ